MVGKILQWIILLVILAVLVYIGLVIWTCNVGPTNPNQPDIPKADEAAYTVYIENTGNLIMTDDYELIGSEVGKRVFILHGFWEMRGQEFVFKDSELVLDEGIFGEITLKRR